ncbi:hypothetical protein [Chryseobacterium indoltheticum]|nr:hypothetical protein [Chryseobacterium indoltheticum]AZA75184.1 hypothetical protein EG358_16055 [Chryseobacterium indoltheticum]
MAKKLKTKIGDIFSVPINDEEKRYMQLIAFDLTQLNSDVVRIFEKKYFLGENPDMENIIKDNVKVYAHCGCDFGLKLNLWKKEGESSNVGNIKDVLFKGTSEYARKEGEEPTKISNKWYIWRINDENFTQVGKLEGENRNAFIGLVINPLGIVELAKGNKYPDNYPDFE